MNKTRFKELDALRGLAAIMVVFFHFTMGKNQADLGFKLGTTGVDLFFIISGFVILLSLKYVKKSSQFIINRISRLYPTYWASVTLTFLVLLFHSFYFLDFSKVSIVEYFGNMTMFQFYLKIPNLDDSYWTMIVELLFYGFMLILFHFKLIKHINKIGIFLTLFIVLMVHFQFENIWVKRLFYYMPLIQFWPLFFTGILFYQIITKHTNLTKYYGMVILCLFSQISLFDYSGYSKKFIDFWEYAVMLIFYFSLMTLFVNGKLKFIINKPSLFLGKISFSLYLIHQVISTEYVIPILSGKLNFNFWFSSGIALVCSLILATGITFLIEVPYSKKMKNKLYKTMYKRL
ncbi:acyltransferase [uncultured Winogradskyella sp.]|uniref:acyltransferase family protein n=1 Tax=uncultured Winogradskyella sp. TaxID=395353 RepID=UPI002630CAE0|nr:acyltransferase [uncultured Winogradskyella sp.]|tara:strand:- start:952 stop:1989 length:1038 start_codon:yes stop_codon:yes gene_type:complete